MKKQLEILLAKSELHHVDIPSRYLSKCRIEADFSNQARMNDVLHVFWFISNGAKDEVLRSSTSPTDCLEQRTSVGPHHPSLFLLY